MVAQLQAENYFARNVDSLDVAFHSKHVEYIGPSLREVLNKVIPHPKPRSKRWISSSVQKSHWHEPSSQLCSAEYHTNNFINPVLLREALMHVPKDAILLEIGPHCLLQAILRRAVGVQASCLGLMKRHMDNLAVFPGLVRQTSHSWYPTGLVTALPSGSVARASRHSQHCTLG
ncbi:hypothetical protein MTO96_030758 [Rhipicephalus appendiculatus]